MCRICGHIWCPTSCPEYTPEDDPCATGRCERCGRVIFGEGSRLCLYCQDEEEEE